MANLTHLWTVNQPIKTFIDGRLYKGLIKEVYPDHLIVNVFGFSDHVWYESGLNLDTLYPDYNF